MLPSILLTSIGSNILDVSGESLDEALEEAKTYEFVYPRTGGTSEANCLNYPFKHAVSDFEYLKTFKLALKMLRSLIPN